MTDEEIKARLHRIYAETGADTDGNTTFHCPVEDAFAYTYEAVRSLNEEYWEALRDAG